MASLGDDLKRYAGEVYTKQDLTAALKLVAEVGGVVSVGLAGLAVLSWAMPLVGIPVTTGALAVALRNLISRYAELDGNQRKRVRLLAKLVRGELPLGDLVDASDIDPDTVAAFQSTEAVAEVSGQTDAGAEYVGQLEFFLAEKPLKRGSD